MSKKKPNEEIEVITSAEPEIEPVAVAMEEKPLPATPAPTVAEPAEWEPPVTAEEHAMTMREWHRGGFLAYCRRTYPGKRLTAAEWLTICQEYLAMPAGPKRS